MPPPRLPRRRLLLPVLAAASIGVATALRTSLPATRVPRLDARTLNNDRYAFEDVVQQGPCVLTHAFDVDAGTRKMGDEAFSDRFFDTFALQDVEVQVKANARGARPRFHTAPLKKVVDGMMAESTHDEAWYLLSENLLGNAPELRDPFVLPPSLFGWDFFTLFPRPVRPKANCLILGGTGARSFLHADPFEWTGVNYLLEGKKLWTFVPPSLPKGALNLERIRPEAWGAEVSAGWMSATQDLYHIQPTVSSTEIVVDLPDCLHGVEGVQAVVQEEGDLIVIPPSWAHQVYHMEPSLCLAWQQCNRSNLRHVVRHMLTWAAENGTGDSKKGVVASLVQSIMQENQGKEEEDEKAWAQVIIDRALLEAMLLQHGPVKGKEAYAKLRNAK